MRTPRQNYIEIESHTEFDGTVVRMQQCLHCGHQAELEQQVFDKTVYPMVEHVIENHLR